MASVLVSLHVRARNVATMGAWGIAGNVVPASLVPTSCARFRGSAVGPAEVPLLTVVATATGNASNLATAVRTCVLIVQAPKGAPTRIRI